MRIIARVKRIDKQIMEELKEEVGVTESLTRKLVMSRLKWAGHVDILERERLKKSRRQKE